MTFTKEQMNKAKSAKTADELLTLAKESGIEMTADEAAKYFAELHKEGELADDELANVSGGCGGDLHDEYPSGSCFDYVSDYNCPICGEEMTYTERVLFSNEYRDVYLCGKSGSSFRLVNNDTDSAPFWHKV